MLFALVHLVLRRVVVSITGSSNEQMITAVELTSTRSCDGDITSEVARRHDDGTWLWVIDRWSVTW